VSLERKKSEVPQECTRIFDSRGWGIGTVPQVPGSISATCCFCQQMLPVTGFVQFLEDGGRMNRPACQPCLASYVMGRWPHLALQTDPRTGAKPRAVEAHHEIGTGFLRTCHNRLGRMLG
jgi:hypothetical protein